MGLLNRLKNVSRGAIAARRGADPDPQDALGEDPDPALEARIAAELAALHPTSSPAPGAPAAASPEGAPPPAGPLPRRL